MNVLAYVHLRNIYRSTGAGRVAREMTENLSRVQDVNLEVLADPGDYERIIPLVGKPWSDYQYHFIASETSRQQARWYFLNSPNAPYYWPDVDVIYCAGESYVPPGRSRLAVTVHDAQLFDNGAHRMDGALLKQRMKWKLLFSRLDRTTDMFHTVSHFSAERLAHHFPAIRSRLRVIPNAVSPHFFDPSTAVGRAVLTRTGLANKPFILVPGGLHFRKNAELILKAWPILSKKHPGLTLAIANHCDPTYVDRASSLAPRLVLTGFLEEEELRAIYQAAEIVWFPSRYEGFGMPVLEAMAGGTPVVTSNSTALPEVAGDAAILVSPDCASDHIDALDGLLKDTATRALLSRRGRNRAARYTWRSSAEQLAGHFASLV